MAKVKKDIEKGSPITFFPEKSRHLAFRMLCAYKNVTLQKAMSEALDMYLKASVKSLPEDVDGLPLKSFISSALKD